MLNVYNSAIRNIFSKITLSLKKVCNVKRIRLLFKCHDYTFVQKYELEKTAGGKCTKMLTLIVSG